MLLGMARNGKRTRNMRAAIFVSLFVTIFLTCEFISSFDIQVIRSMVISNPSSSGVSNLLRQLSSEGEETTHFELFGGVTSLNILIGSVSVIIIVCAVQLVEYFFHTLHLFTHDTPFNQMVHSIEKELMVVGFTAFVFKVIVNSTDFLKLDWFHSLEYAG